jgi:acyl carrier protein
MATSRALSPASISDQLTKQVLQIISRRKAIQPSRLHLGSSLNKELHFDTVDVVDIILALERRFHLIIPDEVPLETVGDFVHYVGAHLPQAQRVNRQAAPAK